MIHGQCVLVVDRSPDLQEVLDAVLSPRGFRVNWWRDSQHRNFDDPTDSPQLVVIDAEHHRQAATDAWRDIPQVIIGTPDDSSEQRTVTRSYLAKPFRYEELVGRIERLLSAIPR